MLFNQNVSKSGDGFVYKEPVGQLSELVENDRVRPSYLPWITCSHFPQDPFLTFLVSHHSLPRWQGYADSLFTTVKVRFQGREISSLHEACRESAGQGHGTALSL